MSRASAAKRGSSAGQGSRMPSPVPMMIGECQREPQQIARADG